MFLIAAYALLLFAPTRELVALLTKTQPQIGLRVARKYAIAAWLIELAYFEQHTAVSLKCFGLLGALVWSTLFILLRKQEKGGAS